jgi:hypothetical protein|nr:MAG TPA: hypothetical protein [Caudoviricetes sp.]
MDDKMIIDFINNVEPDMSYGTSNGMARAMVESAENMALINDYITESTYEVYTEAEDNQGFFTKVKNKIHTYFVLFVNLVRKAIEKVKGFFMTIKRKLTMAIAKALRSVSLKVYAPSKNITPVENAPGYKKVLAKVYIWDEKKVARLSKVINTINGNFSTNSDTFDPEAQKKSFIDNWKPEGLLKELDLSINTAQEFYKNLEKNITSVIDDFFNTTMKSFSETLKLLKTKEEDAKKNYSNDPHKLSAKLKDISKKVHTFNAIRYKGAQITASAALKIYKRSLSVLGKVVKQQKDTLGKV